MIRIIKRAGLALVIVYIFMIAGLAFFQRDMLYIPPEGYKAPQNVDLANAVEVYDPQQGDTLLGWWMEPEDEAAPVVLFFHGNGSAVYSNHHIYARLNAEGFGVFATAYPGYPGRGGKAMQESLTAAAQNGYDYVKAQGVTADRIAFYGTSLGTGIAAQLSTSRRPALLVIEAPFPSIGEMAQRQFPFLPAKQLTFDNFDSRKALSGADIPLFWLHGTHDLVIPMEYGQSLYDSYSGPKRFNITQDAGHIDLWERGGDKLVIDAISAIRQTPVLSKPATLINE